MSKSLELVQASQLLYIFKQDRYLCPRCNREVEFIDSDQPNDRHFWHFDYKTEVCINKNKKLNSATCEFVKDKKRSEPSVASIVAVNASKIIMFVVFCYYFIRPWSK